MSDDIVERLRAIAPRRKMDWEATDQGADEIERLRGEIERLRAELAALRKPRDKFRPIGIAPDETTWQP